MAHKTMRGKVVLGETYITTIGEFTPVRYEKGKFKYENKSRPLWADAGQRLDGRYIDVNGKRLRRKYFIELKAKENV